MSINIYQVFTRLFRNDNGQNVYDGSIEQNGCSKFSHFDNDALAEIKKMGVTHIWFTGVIRHASTSAYVSAGIESDCALIVKGKAGSPYAIKDYYDVSPDLAETVENRFSEFHALINRCHNNNLQVIIDFVPNHVCRQYAGTSRPDNIQEIGADDNSDIAFSPMNNYYYLPGERFIIPNCTSDVESAAYEEFPAKATGNDVFSSRPSVNDWYETVKLNYGVDIVHGGYKHFNPIPDTWYRMLEILLFWSQQGVDGFRIDMAEMIPVEFWNWVIPQVKTQFPHITFTAEVYKPSEYRNFIENGSIDWLYDKEQFYNTIRAVTEGKCSASTISDIWKAQEGIESHLLRFMENHDEQRIASSFFLGDADKAKPAMLLAATMGCGPLMMYFGQEIGEPGEDNEGFSGLDGRTTIFDYWRVGKFQQWVDKGQFSVDKLDRDSKLLREWYADLLNFRLKYSAVLSGRFYDLMWINQHVDVEHVYAFLRFNEDKKILVVTNFDHENSKDIKLIFNEHVIQELGIVDNSTFNANPIFGEHAVVSFKQVESQNFIADFKIQKSSALVFALL